MEIDNQEIADRIANYLKTNREHAGLSKKTVADRSEMSEGRWRQLEKGIERKSGVDHPASTSAKTLIKMARALGADPAELLGIAGFDPEVVDLSDDIERTVVKPPTEGMVDISDLSEQDQRVVRAFIAGMKAARRNDES